MGQTQTTKHTPGPWKSERENVISESPLACVTSESMTICDVLAVDERKWGFDFAETSKANARLIAAAPELFEVCKTFVSSMQSGDIHDDMDRIFRAAIDAIAKIEGGAQ